MPITIAPDPQHPGQYIWVDSATGQPATQPGGPGTPFVGSSDQPPGAAPSGVPAAQPPPTVSTVAQAADPIEQQFRESIATANAQYNNALAQYNAAAAAVSKLPPDDPNDPLGQSAAARTRQQAQSYLESASKNLQTAADAVSRIQEAKAQAYEKGRYATSEEKDLAKARAEDARAQATLRVTQAQVATATSPSEIQKAQADATEAQAKANLTTAQLGVFTATTPDQIQQAHTAVQQAQATLESTQSATARQRALLPSETRTAGAQATTAEATAAVAPQAAQAAVDKAQADVSRTQLEIQDLQRQLRQAPTDEQAQTAIQLQLAQKQTELQTANQQLDSARQLLPLTVQRQQQIIQQTQLGPLYGVEEQKAKIRDMIASGQITADAGNQLLSDWVTKQATGAGSYERAQQQDLYNRDIRQQDMTFNQGMAGHASNFLNTGIGQLTQALGTMTPGHGAEFAGAVQAYSNLWNQIGQRYAQPPAPPSAVSQAPVVHINIGSGTPTSSDQPAMPQPGALTTGVPSPAQPGQPQPANPNVPDNMRAATPQDVMALWGSGGIDRTSQGLGGI
jgi:hypothetical protein